MSQSQQLRALEQFKQIYSAAPSALFFAPGRVNLIGEHTDYNDGFVLPCAIDFGTLLAVRLRSDAVIRVVAGDLDNRVSEWRLNEPIERDPIESWSNYLRGVSAHFFREGIPITGMDIYATGNVPQGAGLSSSASFSVAFATACNQLNQLELSVEAIARICQHAESEFAGCNCGIMDQLASAAGRKDCALMLDCRDLNITSVAIPEALAIMIIDSKTERQLVGSEYNDRRRECELGAQGMGVISLRDADEALLEKHKSELTEVVYRRVRHVITENRRTQEAALALQFGDIARLHRLMAESHISMRDDFEITLPKIDFLVESVEQKLEQDGGARMTGGGFGGCVVALVPKTKLELIAGHVKKRQAEKYGYEPDIYICQAEEGARQITLPLTEKAT